MEKGSDQITQDEPGVRIIRLNGSAVWRLRHAVERPSHRLRVRRDRMPGVAEPQGKDAEGSEGSHVARCLIQGAGLRVLQSLPAAMGRPGDSHGSVSLPADQGRG